MVKLKRLLIMEATCPESFCLLQGLKKFWPTCFWISDWEALF